MNYRHIYHAGNFADIFKHSLLTLLIQNLLLKEKPFCYLDTHAGIGLYDLQSVAAQKTREYESGIVRLLRGKNHPKTLNIYFDIVKKLNSFHIYPGSPYIVRQLVRACDRLILLELHKEDIIILKQQFFNDKQVAVHYYDGYHGLKAFLPPKERRGLVLIDPPFENRDEFERIISSLKIGLSRWPTGIYAIWYPIKDRLAINKFKHDLRTLNTKSILINEIIVSKENNLSNLFIGCGMVIINPPWQIAIKINEVITWLQGILSPLKFSEKSSSQTDH